VHGATTAAVEKLIAGFMRRWLDDGLPSGELDRIRQDGASPSGLLAPFHDALVPGITLLRERSFSTRLGNLHEHVAVLIASAAHQAATRAYSLSGDVPVLAREFITQRLHALEAGSVGSDAITERQALFQAFGQTVAESTTIDLRIVTHSDEEHFFEMKSAKPNKGQCIEMKQRLLTAMAIRRQSKTFAWWGVPYDPYGNAEYAHPYPVRFFDFAREVKVGATFWNFVGNDPMTYEELLGVYKRVGTGYQAELREVLARP
jgi:hypothetical protein